MLKKLIKVFIRKIFLEKGFTHHYDFNEKQPRVNVTTREPKFLSRVLRLKIFLSRTISRRQLPRFPVWV